MMYIYTIFSFSFLQLNIKLHILSLFIYQESNSFFFPLLLFPHIKYFLTLRFSHYPSTFHPYNITLTNLLHLQNHTVHAYMHVYMLSIVCSHHLAIVSLYNPQSTMLNHYQPPPPNPQHLSPYPPVLFSLIPLSYRSS